MEAPRNLNEYRNERIEKLKSLVLDVANDNLLSRTDGDFAAILGKTTPREFELFVLLDSFNGKFTSAPEYVLNEVAIDIAIVLNDRDDLPYTIDLSEISSEPRRIRIVKL